MNASTNQSQIVETLIKKVLTYLDECDAEKLPQFLQLFDPRGCKIIMNAQPFPQPQTFLQTWHQQVVPTQHTITSVDYHVIPGTGTVVCNANCKVRFDESGKDKLGNDSIVPIPAAQPNKSTTARARRIWGTYYGVSLQFIASDTIFNNNLTSVISSLNYTIVYKPDDSLMRI